jgi:hypothetical protein
MRKLMLATTLAVLGVGLLATSASAFDHHFYVHQKYRSGHDGGPNGPFVSQHKLKDPHNRTVRVGRDRFVCRAKHGGGTLSCRALVHLNGRIGGKGYIRVRGEVHHGDKYMKVVGGTRQFNGVRGRVFWNGIRIGFDLR